MSNTHIWLFTLVGISAVLLTWRKKRQYDRTNEHGVQKYSSYWKKLKGDSFDTALLLLGYTSLFAFAVLLVTLDPSLLAWLIVVTVVIAWVKFGGTPRN